jgi:hypothetical protein
MATELSEEDKKRIARAAQEAANRSVLRQLSHLVGEWREEERLKKRGAILVLLGFAVAVAMVAVVIAR